MNEKGACPPTAEAPMAPRIIAWELTRRCPLHCKHCRADAHNRHDDNELSTEQCLKVLESIAGFAKPIMILTGGEPLLRDDLAIIARRCKALGFHTVLATCGSLVNDEVVEGLKDMGIQAISLSLDGADERTHDHFRGVSGAFKAAVHAARLAKTHDLPFQINTTVSQYNLSQLDAIYERAIALGAVTFNPFLLVPTGRGKHLQRWELSANDYEATLNRLADKEEEGRIAIRVTCAPQYQRIIRQRHGEPDGKAGGGCLGGKSFAFISSTGVVQICGFLDTPAGELRDNDFDFQAIWNHSPFLQTIRDTERYQGKCGVCDYQHCCGGCRARTYALTGDVLGAEPYCAYQPGNNHSNAASTSSVDNRTLGRG